MADLFQDIYRNEIAPEYRAFKKMLNKHRIKTAFCSVSVLFSLPKKLLSYVLPTHAVAVSGSIPVAPTIAPTPATIHLAWYKVAMNR
jgi:hypothetical protein